MYGLARLYQSNPFTWCADAKDVVVLQNVEYGTKGSFTINIWMKKDISTDLFGGSHQYIFSHTSLDIANAPQISPSEPNQVCADCLDPFFSLDTVQPCFWQ